jgi:aminoglycoside phosphotransferase (APT) family kinase protein
MTTARGTTLPDHVDAITPEWLSLAVSERFPDAHAEAVEIVDAHSGTTGRAALRVRWKAGCEAPSALFGKLAPTDPLQRQMVALTDMGRREARFYAALARDMPIRVPAPIWSGWSSAPEGANEYFMLIEDLAAAGCRFPAPGDHDADRYAEEMIDTLAALHGHFWASSRFDGDLEWIEAPMRSSYGPLLVEEGLRQFGDRMPEAFHALARLYLEHNEAVCDWLDSGPATLLHGDSHSGNTFLDGDRVGLLDWACVCRGPGLRDVSYFLCNSVPTKLRRERESALLARYLEKLEAAGGEPPSFEEAWRRHRGLATCSWIAATVTAAAGSRMQSVEIGLRAMDRSTKAILDLETPDLLREELGL